MIFKIVYLFLPFIALIIEKEATGIKMNPQDILLCMETKKNTPSFDFYCILFFVLAFAGWIWEVILYLFTEHTFVNRGVYKGPYLPIYGVGGILLYFLFYRLKARPWLVFLNSLILCSLLEYFASWFLEMQWGIRWWDYGEHFMNINGRICLLGALSFGIGGMILICFIIPFYEKLLEKIPIKVRLWLSILLILLFVADAAYAGIRPNTGYGITVTAAGAADIEIAG